MLINVVNNFDNIIAVNIIFIIIIKAILIILAMIIFRNLIESIYNLNIMIYKTPKER